MKHVALAATLAVGGLIAPFSAHADDAPADGHAPAQYLIMEPNAEIIFITTGGAEVRADWTEAATNNLRGHFSDQISSAGYTVTGFDSDAQHADEIQQLLYLFELVSASADLNMPHKGGRGSNHDITLGETASLLREHYNADRAIFVDHYSQIESGGVFMTQVLVGTATGFTPPSQNVRATIGTIIDLETGDIVERAQATLGDARDEGESAGIVTRVLNNLPLE
ncbi:hypothetical protein [Maricaulis maris]|uniref:Uncharacterized protein n=1 Tax=Maricaulis maris TaxID=74318 RepID=A0A495D2P5_9PROT|nr:hypothetical protein [Maricaulis maris]RKQ96048.1 hypothetical protein C7435_2299 [Maricaulis maris]